jgi:hypothetical protein
VAKSVLQVTYIKWISERQNGGTVLSGNLFGVVIRDELCVASYDKGFKGGMWHISYIG